MTASSFKMVRHQAPAANGAGDTYTDSGFGTPSAALFLMGEGTSDGTAEGDVRYSIGVWDGTSQAGVSAWALDASTDRSSATVAKCHTDTGVCYLSPPSYRKAIASSATDGVELTWSGGTQNSFLVNALLIKCNGAKAGYATITGTVSGSTNIAHGLGTTPKLVLFACGDITTTGDTASGNMQFSMGFASKSSGSIVQRYVGHQVWGDAASNPHATLNTNASFIHWDTSTTATRYEVTGMDATNVTITNQGGSALDQSVAYLILDMDEDVDIFTFNTPTSAQEWGVTGGSLSGQSQLAMLLSTMCQATGTVYGTSPDAESFGMYVNDGTNEYGWSGASEAGVADTVAWDVNSKHKQGLLVVDNAGADHIAAANPTLGATDITFPSAGMTMDATSRYGIGFSIYNSLAPGQVNTIGTYSA